ncbi:zinc-alpha-2-glycoprotein-like [Anomaloglossus baeobatrachus]|uniref:zinc-alpha-2-glycoprotein-like n=1 Tax=Anomaloglossus baeobatrachus TaxID=238106 RepID=UPI003F4F5517
MFALALLILTASGVYCGGHSLRYYYTGVSALKYGLPEFSIVGYLDDPQIELYTSDIGRSIPVAPWLKKNERPEHWDRMTNIAKEHETLFRDELKIGMKRFNHTGGFHFVQVMHSCELKDDGSIGGYEKFTYDGRDYMYLDTSTGTFIPSMPEAQIITQRWNGPDVIAGERIKIYLKTECIDRLKRFLEHGREVLERRVRPRVKVSSQEKGDTMKLHCQVYGFHPRAVDVRWMNREDEVPSYETTHVLPNPDGTYQIRVSVEVTPKEGDRYSCNVDHSSLEEPLLVQWEQEKSPAVIIIIVGVIVIASFLAGAGIFIYKKKKKKPIVLTDFHMSFAAGKPMQPKNNEDETNLTPSVAGAA